MAAFDEEEEEPSVVSPLYGVGVSDTTLVAMSMIGFGVLLSIMYVLLMARLKTDVDSDDQLNGDDYDEQLDKADVSTLNRAQRRARAKMIMKRQRRIDGGDGDGNGNDGDAAREGQGQADDPALGDDGEGGDDAGQDGQEGQQHLSRKERQKAAKETERQERRLMEDSRRLQQEKAQALAQKRKQEKERRLAEEARLAKLSREQAAEEQKRAAYTEWRTFLSCGEVDSMTVSEFVRYARTNRSVNVDLLADRFQTPSGAVVARIQELIVSRRLTGIILDGQTFVYLTEVDLKKVAALVHQRGQVSMEDLGGFLTDSLHLHDDHQGHNNKGKGSNNTDNDCVVETPPFERNE